MKSHRGILWLSSVLSAAAFAVFASGAASAQKTELLVYTALETDQLKAYADAFNKAVPDVEIKWVRDSTGVITSKLIAEKANPQADVVWGLAATSLLVLESDGMLLPYAPAGLAAIGAAYKDSKNPPAWWGMDVWGATVCFNTVEAAKMNLPKPETWQDLTKPIYKGKIVMPNPASSGTGYLDVTSWLQIMGEQNGWKFMDGLHENIAQYTHSGSKPCVQAGAGEFPIGISFEYRANTIKAKGGPIDLDLPQGRPRLGHGSLRDHEEHEEARRGEEARRLGVVEGRDDRVREELRDRRGAGHRAAAAQRAGRLREAPREERLRVGGQEPRPHPRRVDQALRRQVRAEEVTA